MSVARIARGPSEGGPLRQISACQNFQVAALDPFLDRNSLYLVERDFILPPVVQLRRPGRFMIGDMLPHFQLATVLKIRGDAGCAEGMIADLRLDAGGFRAPLDHAVGVLLVHGLFREDA
jgi:hypothetical protein